MSQCAKPLDCDTPLRVSRSLRSLESYSLTENQSLLRSLFDMVATYFAFANVSDRLWGWTRFLQASGASEQRSQFPSYRYTLYYLAYNSCYYLILSDISDITVRCGNSTTYVKLFINCIHLSVGNRIKTSGSSGWCEYFNVPMCQTVGLWHTSPRTSLVVLARKL